MITARAYAKINWSLSICGTRPDGYHDLDMLMQRISLYDELTFESSASLSLTVDSEPVPADSDNLVLKAARALNAYTGQNHGAAITLTKHIPARAGLAGGSADCACALTVLNRMWSMNLSRETLEAIGLKLGADVPFCLHGCFCRAQGLGEILTPLPAAPQVYIAMVTPGDGLSTPQVFKTWNAGGFPATAVDNIALSEVLNRGDFEKAQLLSRNDLEAPAIALMPQIAEIITTFSNLGARFVRMTGSGSTVFAVFTDETAAEEAADRVSGAVAVKTLGFTEPL